MNANPKFLAATAHVDDAAVHPLPNSRKVYIGALRVPMREITQTAGNPPITVYDTSGPYTDPDARIDIRSGLAPLREKWITARADTVQLDGPTPEEGRRRRAAPNPSERRSALHPKPKRSPLGWGSASRLRPYSDDPKLSELRFDLHRKPRRGKNVSQMHYA